MLTPEELSEAIQKKPMTKYDVEHIVKHNIYRISNMRLTAKGILVPVRRYDELFDMCLSSLYGLDEAKITSLHEMLHIKHKAYIERSICSSLTPQEMAIEKIIDDEANRLYSETNLANDLFFCARALNKIAD